MDPIEILPAIPGHAHSFDGAGRPTCGCIMPVVNVTPTGPTPHLNDRDRQDTCWCGAPPGAPHNLHAPDFGQIAAVIALTFSNAPALMNVGDQRKAVAAIIEQLRQVWNLRGAADLDAANEIAHTNWERIEDAIRSLDR
jgi:hypothetical protein